MKAPSKCLNCDRLFLTLDDILAAERECPLVGQCEAAQIVADMTPAHSDHEEPRRMRKERDL